MTTRIDTASATRMRLDKRLRTIGLSSAFPDAGPGRKAPGRAQRGRGRDPELVPSESGLHGPTLLIS